MSSDLSSFATRLREVIALNSDELATDPGFDRLARELFALQFQSNAAFRKFCEAKGVSPKTVVHWTDIPAVPTTAFKELDLTCLSPGERTVVFHSSGTTAQRPSRHFHSAESLALYEASLRPWFERHLLSDQTSRPSHLALLTPGPEAAPQSSLVHMFETVRTTLWRGDAAFLADVSPVGDWVLDFDHVRRTIRSALESDRPLVLLGTAFSFVHLLDFLAAQKLRFRLPAGSCVMETGGYKGRARTLPRAELHGLIAEYLDIPVRRIIREYGMSEVSSQAYDGAIGGSTGASRESERCFRFPPWCRARVISPEQGGEVADGETGLLRLVDLANAFSVMTVQTEDLALRRGGGFELIGRAEAAEPRGCSLMSAVS